jgi:hypothetical protein
LAFHWRAHMFTISSLWFRTQQSWH